ncbi:MAG TPA: universal stress protein [Rubrobacter sp.]|nr:universal stress protein [Rubrobacter sp.]
MEVWPRTILLATDGSEDAALAARAASNLAEKTGAELHVVHVVRYLPPHAYADARPKGYEELYHKQVKELLDEQVRLVEAEGGKDAKVHFRVGSPVAEILRLAQELAVDLIVVGSRGLGRWKRLTLGSVSEGVVYHAPCPVLVLRGGNEVWPPSRIVVGEDSSDDAQRAGELAASIGTIFGANVVLVRAYVEFPEISEEVRVSEGILTLEDALRYQERELEERASALEREVGVPPQVRLSEGYAAAVIAAIVEEGGEPTLTVVGRRGLGTLDRLILGSVSSKVMRVVKGPVLLAPRKRGSC